MGLPAALKDFRHTIFLQVRAARTALPTFHPTSFRMGRCLARRAMVTCRGRASRRTKTSSSRQCRPSTYRALRCAALRYPTRKRAADARGAVGRCGRSWSFATAPTTRERCLTALRWFTSAAPWNGRGLARATRAFRGSVLAGREDSPRCCCAPLHRHANGASLWLASLARVCARPSPSSTPTSESTRSLSSALEWHAMRCTGEQRTHTHRGSP